MKLPIGSMNAMYTVCKPGYADGVIKPQRPKKTQPKATVTRLRKQEGLII
jgi:hypothetical protein